MIKRNSTHVSFPDCSRFGGRELDLSSHHVDDVGQQGNKTSRDSMKQNG